MKKIDELGISPSPWRVCTCFNGQDVDCLCDANGKTIVETDCGVYPPKMTDACMMGASPELYDSLYDVVAYCEATHLVPSERFKKVLEKAKRAISKAAGELKKLELRQSAKPKATRCRLRLS